MQFFFYEIQHGYTGMQQHFWDYRDHEEMQRIMMQKVHKVKFICNKNNFSGVNVYSNNWKGVFFIYFYILKIFLHRV